ncbi:transglutaminase domain-containing protein [Desulfuromonas versatilis]|nr:transglutaminase domain-containing protein [Desulfuromonas versatilis]
MLTEGLESVLTDPAMEVAGKKQRLKERKGEIDVLDAEVRKQFAETEKRLKEAGLPAEILERHVRFVKHYDENLKELKGNLDRIEKAKDKKEAEAAIEKAEKHLKKAKAPSRHTPFDPNNLPNRQPKGPKREPRMKKEEFEQDLKKDANAWMNQKRVLVASTGSLAGLLAPENLAETIEVQLAPEIRNKALELEKNPVKIYEWVRHNIEFVPTWGSIQGAQMTLETKQGNAFDTASLLIALLRAAGIEARYVTGTVELPIDKVMNWVGGFTDPMAALDFMSSGGIPTKGLVAGGKIVAARFEHVWVEAHIDYLPSRGAKHVEGAGDTWVSLDPSYKQYDYTEGLDLKSAVPFDAQTFLDQVNATATVNESQGYATGVNSLLVQQSLQDYQAQFQNYLQQNHPDATVGDVLGRKDVVKQELPYLLGTLPYRTAVKGATFAAIPDGLRHKLSFRVESEAVNVSYFDPDAPAEVDNSLRLTKSLPELAGKKITLSYSPATPQDEAVINSYLPKPHADGSPIRPSELPSSLPAYLINVKPELRIDGQLLATGAALGLGGTNIFTMTFFDPAYGASQITNYIDAGVFQSIGLNLGRISPHQLTALKASLEAIKAKLEGQNFAGLTKDELVGDLLYATTIAYHAELGALNTLSARTMGVNALSLPSETIFATKLKVLTLWGIPRFVQPGGLNMDADYLIQVAKAKDGNNDTVKQYMLGSGMTSSALEHKVPEVLFSTPGNPVQAISTVKALKIANDQGIPIFTVNQANIATVLPQLQIDQQVKNDIQNAVNAGNEVTVSKGNISSNGWTGCGYIITAPETGAGAYMITGGGNGADVQALLLLGEILLYCLAAAGAVAIALLAIIFAGVPGAFAATLPTFASGIAAIVEAYTAITLTISSLIYSLPEVAIIIGETYFSLQIGLTMTGLLPGGPVEWWLLVTAIRINLYYYFKRFVYYLKNHGLFLVGAVERYEFIV